MVKKVIQADLSWRLRIFWIVVALGVSSVFVGVGGGYTFGGKSSVYSLAAFKILTNYFPHGLRAHGIILLSLGCGLLVCVGITLSGYASKYLKDFVLYVAIASMLYSLWCAIAYATAWYVNNHYNSGVFWYLGASIFTSALAFLPPPFVVKGMRDESN